MDESTRALRVAFQTMKERCQQLQSRVYALEEENLTLKLKSNRDNKNSTSITECDRLKARISELSAESTQIQNNALMVASENRQLWSRLTKLIQTNQNLGLQLTQINDTINHHTKSSSPLIRSKTFTQQAPHTKHLQKTLVENDKISLELEDISLKLLTSITKEKNELELQCTEMAQLQTGTDVLRNSIGFTYMEDDESMGDDLEQHLNGLLFIKNSLLVQKEKLVKSVNTLQNYKVEICKKCADRKRDNISKTMIIPNENKEEKLQDEIDTNRQLESLAEWSTSLPSNTFMGIKTTIPDKICPMCSNKFTDDVTFNEFVKHVEKHFTLNEAL